MTPNDTSRHLQSGIVVRLIGATGPYPGSCPRCNVSSAHRYCGDREHPQGHPCKTSLSMAALPDSRLSGMTLILDFLHHLPLPLIALPLRPCLLPPALQPLFLSLSPWSPARSSSTRTVLSIQSSAIPLPPSFPGSLLAQICSCGGNQMLILPLRLSHYRACDTEPSP